MQPRDHLKKFRSHRFTEPPHQAKSLRIEVERATERRVSTTSAVRPRPSTIRLDAIPTRNYACASFDRLRAPQRRLARRERRLTLIRAPLDAPIAHLVTPFGRFVLQFD